MRRSQPSGSGTAIPTDARVEHREWGRGVVMSADDDRIGVLFDAHGYRTLSVAAVLDRGLLWVL